MTHSCPHTNKGTDTQLHIYIFKYLHIHIQISRLNKDINKSPGGKNWEKRKWSQLPVYGGQTDKVFVFFYLSSWTFWHKTWIKQPAAQNKRWGNMLNNIVGNVMLKYVISNRLCYYWLWNTFLLWDINTEHKV